MCITSVTISHKAISSGVECASSSHKQEKYSSVWLGQLPVNPEKQLLLQQQSGMVLLLQPRSTCLTAASGFKKRFQSQSKSVLGLSLVSESSLQHFGTCQPLPLASAAICATGAPADVLPVHQTLFFSRLKSLTPSASHFSLFVSQLKCILHRLHQSRFYRDHLLI